MAYLGLSLQLSAFSYQLQQSVKKQLGGPGLLQKL